MTAPVYLDYFYGDEVKIDSFYRLSRVFLTDEFYRRLSTEVKYLYTLMLDRVPLSMRNGWREADGRVFIYFTLKDARQALNVGKNKAVSLFHQLEKLDLIRRRKQGQGKPARVFVRTFVEAAPDCADVPAPDCAETPPSMVMPERETMEATPEREITMATPNTEAVMFAEAAPVPEPTAQTAPAKIPTPIHDVKRTAPSVEEQSKQSATRTETPEAVQRGVIGLLNDCAVGVRRLGDILAQRLTNGGGIPANAAAPAARTEPTGKPICDGYIRDLTFEGAKWRNVSLIRGEIQANVALPILKAKRPADIEEIVGYTEIMVEACCGQTPTVRINGSEYSRELVRQRMYELDSTHLEYVLDCMKECAPKVRNIRAYILTALFNSYDTIDLYYGAKISHKMARARKAYERDDYS